jgi:hypothetical protein
MKKKFLFFLLVPFLFKCSCQKDKVYPTYYMDQEFKDYCVFPVGSYWVYEDSASKSIDSISVYRSEISMIEKSNKHSYNYEQFFMGTTRSSTTDTTFAYGLPSYSQDKFYVYREGFNNSFLYDYVKFFSIKDTGYVLGYSETSTLKYDSNSDSTVINNKKYYRIMKFSNLFSSNPPYAEEKRIFYSSKIGIIRRELRNGQVWNLIRYHIN